MINPVYGASCTLRNLASLSALCATTLTVWASALPGLGASDHALAWVGQKRAGVYLAQCYWSEKNSAVSALIAVFEKSEQGPQLIDVMACGRLGEIRALDARVVRLIVSEDKNSENRVRGAGALPRFSSGELGNLQMSARILALVRYIDEAIVSGIEVRPLALDKNGVPVALVAQIGSGFPSPADALLLPSSGACVRVKCSWASRYRVVESDPWVATDDCINLLDCGSTSDLAVGPRGMAIVDGADLRGFDLSLGSNYLCSAAAIDASKVSSALPWMQRVGCRVSYSASELALAVVAEQADRVLPPLELCCSPLLLLRRSGTFKELKKVK
jgi:hypothetical protein